MRVTMNKDGLSKIPEVTLGFWIIKIAATTLGETGGDSVTMTLNWGYLAGTAIFLAALVVLVAAQILAKRFHPFLYWATIVASTTFGTTMADFCDRSLGIGYTGGSSLLLALLLGTLALWYFAEGSISVETCVPAQGRSILLGRHHVLADAGNGARGLDRRHDRPRLRRRRNGVFAAALVVVAALYYRTNISRVALFWTAFILTRPLGATVGDFLDKPVNHGGMALSRPIASAVIAMFIVGCLLVLPQRAGRHPGVAERVG